MDVPFSRLLSVLHTLTDEQKHLVINTIRQGVEADGPVMHLTSSGVTSRCGLSGRTAVMRRNVTCPICRVLIQMEEATEVVHWLHGAIDTFAFGRYGCDESVTSTSPTMLLRTVTMDPSQVTCPKCRDALTQT